jgi:hypothetical protein
MKRTISAVLAVMMLLPIVLLTSCGGASALIGTWKTSTDSLFGTVESSYTFEKDGVGSITSRSATSLGFITDFTYEVDGDTLTIVKEIPGTGVKTIEEFTFEVKGDKLTLTKDNETTIYTKAE